MMKKAFLARCLAFLIVFVIGIAINKKANAQLKVPGSQQQIEAATTTAPKALRTGAKVYGYTDEGEWTTLREGTNALICIADDPAEANFHVACYFKGLEPFMKRGRELERKGLLRKEKDAIRRQEIDSGDLPMPDKPMALYSLTGQEGAYDYEQGELVKAKPLCAIYIPYTTRSEE